MERTKSLRGGHRRSDRAARASSRSSPAAPRSAPAGRTTRLRSQPLSRVAPAVAIHRTTRIRTRTRTRHIERHAHPRYKKTAATQRRTHTEMPGGRSSGATASAERQHRGATASRGDSIQRTLRNGSPIVPSVLRCGVQVTACPTYSPTATCSRAGWISVSSIGIATDVGQPPGSPAPAPATGRHRSPPPRRWLRTRPHTRAGSRRLRTHSAGGERSVGAMTGARARTLRPQGRWRAAACRGGQRCVAEGSGWRCVAERTDGPAGHAAPALYDRAWLPHRRRPARHVKAQQHAGPV